MHYYILTIIRDLIAIYTGCRIKLKARVSTACEDMLPHVRTICNDIAGT